MSPLKPTLQLIIALMLTLGISQTWAQGVMTNDAKMGTLNDNRLMDVNVIGVSDPQSVDILFKEGDTITSILKAFNDKGFHIQYREKQFSDDMVLLNIPTAVGIDNVLREILEPWNFTAHRTPFGKVVVTPVKSRKKKEPEESPASVQDQKPAE